MNPNETPAPTRKEREAARHRQEILDVAMRLFADGGYHETTMQMIADAAEFSVGYLYKHFPGKEDMFRAMVDTHVTFIDDVIAEVQARGLPPLVEMRAIYEAICEHFNHHRDFMRIYHQRIDGGICAIEERKQGHQDNIVRSIRQALDEGSMRSVDPVLLAAMIQGAAEELFHVLSERDEPRPFDTLTDTLFSLLIDPLRT
jgi:AcrR family transcriptional regulator